MIYICAFVLSISLMYLAEKKNRKIYIFLSAFILIILAALRDESVGYDVKVYQSKMFAIAKNSANVVRFYNNEFISTVEPLYSLVTYLASKIGGIFWLFLFNEVLVILFLFLSIWKFRECTSPYRSLACYLFVYYLWSYDIIRQMIAMMIVLYAISLLFEERYKTCVVMMLLAIGFHTSAVVGFAVMLIKILCDRKSKRIYVAIIVFLTVVISFSFRELFTWIVRSIPFLPEKYISASYLTIAEGGIDFSVSKFAYIVMALSSILIYVLFGIKATGNNSKNEYSGIEMYYSNCEFFLCMMVISLGGVIVGSVARFANRAFYYMEMFSIFTIPNIKYIFRDDKKNRLLVNVLMYSFLIAFCVEYLMILNVAGVFPYKFAK